MRFFRHGLCRSTRSNNRMASVTFLFALCSFSVVIFIYNSPGRANAYLYQFHIFQNSVYNAMQQGGVSFIRQMANGSSDYNWISTDYVGGEPPDFVFLPENYTYSKDEVCPEKFPEMKGKMDVNLTEVSLEEMNARFGDQVAWGGSWHPTDCIGKYKVAVMIPFRDRPTHLPILLRHIYPMMMSQRLNFTIFLIEQRGEYPFNRAMLFNVGFVEINRRFGNFDCLLFHDVDHIPENDRNYYGCSNMPRHFAEELDIHAYKLEYYKFFGGVSGVTSEQFSRVNGYSNKFWGWGGEDDDFYNRIEQMNWNISRPPYHYGRYSSIKKNHNQAAMFLGRFSLLKSSIDRMNVDGLNSVPRFVPPHILIQQNQLYTNISVELYPVKDVVPPTPRTPHLPSTAFP